MRCPTTTTRLARTTRERQAVLLLGSTLRDSQEASYNLFCIFIAKTVGLPPSPVPLRGGLWEMIN